MDLVLWEVTGGLSGMAGAFVYAGVLWLRKIPHPQQEVGKMKLHRRSERHCQALVLAGASVCMEHGPEAVAD